MQTRPTGAPAPRSVASWSEAELNAIGWLDWLGHPGAGRTAGGANGGIDVLGADMAAWVRWSSEPDGEPIGVRALRELMAAAHGTPGDRYFFSNAGFTEDAISFADSVGCMLFTFSLDDGLVSPASQAAAAAFRASAGRPRPSSPADPPQTPAAAAKRARPLPRRVVMLGTVPFVMFIAGLLFIGVLRFLTDAPPDWMSDVWAMWMSIAFWGIVGVGVTALIRWASARWS